MGLGFHQRCRSVVTSRAMCGTYLLGLFELFAYTDDESHDSLTHGTMCDLTASDLCGGGLFLLQVSSHDVIGGSLCGGVGDSFKGDSAGSPHVSGGAARGGGEGNN